MASNKICNPLLREKSLDEIIGAKKEIIYKAFSITIYVLNSCLQSQVHATGVKDLTVVGFCCFF